jgi:uncharacterized coiled-coil protein SlyX
MRNYELWTAISQLEGRLDALNERLDDLEGDLEVVVAGILTVWGLG